MSCFLQFFFVVSPLTWGDGGGGWGWGEGVYNDVFIRTRVHVFASVSAYLFIYLFGELFVVVVVVLGESFFFWGGGSGGGVHPPQEMNCLPFLCLTRRC